MVECGLEWTHHHKALHWGAQYFNECKPSPRQEASQFAFSVPHPLLYSRVLDSASKSLKKVSDLISDIGNEQFGWRGFAAPSQYIRVFVEKHHCSSMELHP